MALPVSNCMLTAMMQLTWIFVCLAVVYVQMLENPFSVMSHDVCKTFFIFEKKKKQNKKNKCIKQSRDTKDNVQY